MRQFHSVPSPTTSSPTSPPSTTGGTRISLFGTLAVRTGNGTSIDLGSPMQRALFALLALNARRVVSTDEIIDALWGEHAPRTAAHSVQIYVSELRKALAATAEPTISTVRPGYRLDADEDAVDVLAFERRAVADDRDSLMSALAMWTAQPLDDFRYETWPHPHLHRLIGLRADAAERLAALVLPDDARAALRWALLALDIDPYRERACELAMLRHDPGLADTTDAAPAHAARRRRWPVVTMLTAGAAVAAVLIAILAADKAPPVRDALLLRNLPGVQITLQFEKGFAEALDELGYRGRSVEVAADDAAVADALGAGPDVVVMAAVGTDPVALAAANPDVHFVMFDTLVQAPNTTSVIVNTHEASFLAGAAAALTSSTGTLGFLGGVDEELIWEFAAGFAAGANAVDPHVRVLTRYLASPPDWGDGFENPVGGHDAARELYEQGADIVFAAAGTSGLGVFQAASEVTAESGIFRWAIGVDTDEYETVVERPLGVDPIPLQRHILTSVVKHSDVVVRDALLAYDRGDAVPGVRTVGLAEGAVDISYSGGFLDSLRPTLESLRRSILAGEIAVPCRPSDRAGRTTPERPHPCS